MGIGFYLLIFKSPVFIIKCIICKLVINFAKKKKISSLLLTLYNCLHGIFYGILNAKNILSFSQWDLAIITFMLWIFCHYVLERYFGILIIINSVANSPLIWWYTQLLLIPGLEASYLDSTLRFWNGHLWVFFVVVVCFSFSFSFFFSFIINYIDRRVFKNTCIV